MASFPNDTLRRWRRTPASLPLWQRGIKGDSEARSSAEIYSFPFGKGGTRGDSGLGFDPPSPPFSKGGRRLVPLWQRGTKGDLRHSAGLPLRVFLDKSAHPHYSLSNDAGWSSPVARWAHNPKVAGSNPAPATTHVTTPGTTSPAFFCWGLASHGNETQQVRTASECFS